MGEALEIRVRATTEANALASSIFNAFMEGRDITLCAIGPVPVSTSHKAVCIANRYLAQKKSQLAIVPGLSTRQIFDKASKTHVPWVISTLRLVDIIALQVQ